MRQPEMPAPNRAIKTRVRRSRRTSLEKESICSRWWRKRRCGATRATVLRTASATVASSAMRRPLEPPSALAKRTVSAVEPSSASRLAQATRRIAARSCTGAYVALTLTSAYATRDGFATCPKC